MFEVVCLISTRKQYSHCIREEVYSILQHNLKRQSRKLLLNVCTEKRVISHLAYKCRFKAVALETGLPFLIYEPTWDLSLDKWSLFKTQTMFLICQHLECDVKDNCDTTLDHFCVLRAQGYSDLSSPFMLEDVV